MQTEDITRPELIEAVAFARERLREVIEAYEQRRTLDRLRAKQVAEDELAALLAEQREFDDARDVQAVRRADAHQRRGGRGWPVGKAVDVTAPRRRVVSRHASVERVVPAAGPTPPPRQASTSWWVGADRRTLHIGSLALAERAKRAPGPTPMSKRTIQKVEQEAKEAQVVEPRLASAGGFSMIPRAE